MRFIILEKASIKTFQFTEGFCYLGGGGVSVFKKYFMALDMTWTNNVIVEGFFY